MSDVAIAPVTLTEAAAREIRNFRSQPGFNPNQYLRIGVKGGGCSGMSYVLGFDEKQDADNEFESNGVKCLINKQHSMYLLGIEVDWQENDESRGFTFSNPNASNSCGCGSSFAV